MPGTPIKCVFFDRDGIVNIAPVATRYVESLEDFTLQPGFVEVLREVTDLGFKAIVVTNQRGLATGALDKDNVEAIHQHLKDVLASEFSLTLLDIYVCPHDNHSCDCRKPLPGMLLAAAEKYGIALDNSWMIGDKPTDMQAGRSAGCRTILVGKEQSPLADYHFSDMNELHSRIAQLLRIG
jgi:D-glycero-D-manno-heptose 1,7-bisphosphate phosphatase